MRVSYFHPTCARKAVSFDMLFDVLREGRAQLPGGTLSYQIGYHHPKACNECAGIITSDQGLVTLERQADGD